MSDARLVTPRRRPDPRFVRVVGPRAVTPIKPPIVRSQDGDGNGTEPERATSSERPAFVTIPDVELLDQGTWEASTGTFTATADDLAAAVAAEGDPTIRAPVLKFGHTDPDFNGQHLREMLVQVAVAFGVDEETAEAIAGHMSFKKDGNPAIGRVKNLRLSEDGLTLLGDYVGVPQWLAEVLPVAYPARSIEAFFDYKAPSGRTHDLVIFAVALLGESPPAVTSLEDVRSMFYGDGPDAEDEASTEA